MPIHPTQPPRCPHKPILPVVLTLGLGAALSVLLFAAPATWTPEALLLGGLLLTALLAGYMATSARHTAQLAQANQQLLLEVTERQRAEEELRSSESRLQLQFDRMPIACITWDRERRVTSWNPAAEAMFGFTAQEALGKQPQQFLISPEQQPLVQQVAQRLLAGDSSVQDVNQNLTKDGRTILCEWTNTPLRDPAGAFAGSLSMVQDITERKSMEKQLLRAQRVESIGTLASGIAHDLNNILAPIMMSAQILQLNKPGEEEREILATIQASAQRGADIVKQVLTFARGVEGERVTLQPNHLIKEMQSIANETFPKNITFRCNVPRDLWTVTGDATQLHQVLLNLCVNARDAMPDGGALLVSAENVQVAKAGLGLFANGKAGPHVLVQVSDTGHGIPPAIIEKIFDPFFTTKEQGKGTGLGLSTVFGIVRSHGGFLDVQSQPGRGSTFKVYLPAQPGKAVLRADATPQPSPRGAGECILVVDDEASIRSVTERTLTQHGYQVLVAANGKEALGLLASHPAAVKAVVTDVMMPVMDGMALALALKQSYPQMPVIACTGWGQEGIQAKLKGLGVESFLEKPYPSSALLTTLRQRLPAAR
jgi:PAS domain S-box-containing protein